MWYVMFVVDEKFVRVFEFLDIYVKNWVCEKMVMEIGFMFGFSCFFLDFCLYYEIENWIYYVVIEDREILESVIIQEICQYFDFWIVKCSGLEGLKLCNDF